jgi:uncharacterized protein YjbI with pentapeptide repeats
MRWPAWLGVGERRWNKSPDEEVQPPKTLWDFLQLLIVPAILVVIALGFNAAQASRDQKREDRRIREDRALAESAREDAILDAYFAKMSTLMLDRGLRTSRKGEVRQVARTVTLATLRRLDGSRKGDVVRFLAESRLLFSKRTDLVNPKDPSAATGTVWSTPAIDLNGADLSGVDLVNASLSGSSSFRGSGDYYQVLSGNLRGARFDHASLYNVRFGGTDTHIDVVDLRGASFNGAFITQVELYWSDLRGASFKGARVEHGNFDKADLTRAVFDNATIIEDTNLNYVCVNNATFVGTHFNSEEIEGGREVRHIGGQTDFVGARGHDVNFSSAHNLASVRLGVGVTNARFDGADGRPKAVKPPGPGYFQPRTCH